MGVPTAPDAIILALTPGAQHILLCPYSGERDKRVEEVEEEENEEEGREKWGGQIEV